MNMTRELYVNIAGVDYVVEVDAHVVAGYPMRAYGAPEDCYPAADAEIEIESIRIYEDMPDNSVKYLDIPGWLRETLIQWAYDQNDLYDYDD